MSLERDFNVVTTLFFIKYLHPAPGPGRLSAITGLLVRRNFKMNQWIYERIPEISSELDLTMTTRNFVFIQQIFLNNMEKKCNPTKIVVG